ncbi:MAG: VTT domain-containing protein [Promethearchaeota archaeon]
MDETSKTPTDNRQKNFVLRILPFLSITYGSLAIFITTILLSNKIQTTIINGLTFFQEFDQAHGATWAFLFMLIGNSTNIPIGIPATYFFAKSMTMGEMFWPNLIIYSALAGSGAGVGQIAVYALGRGSAHLFKEKKGIRNMQYLAGIITRKKTLAPILVYIIAFTPIPDQLIMIPLGIAKYPIKRTIIPSVLGKITFCFFLAISATIGGKGAEEVTVMSIIQESLLITILLTAFIIAFAIDWQSVFLKKLKTEEGRDGMA